MAAVSSNSLMPSPGSSAPAPGCRRRRWPRGRPPSTRPWPRTWPRSRRPTCRGRRGRRRAAARRGRRGRALALAGDGQRAGHARVGVARDGAEQVVGPGREVAQVERLAVAGGQVGRGDVGAGHREVVGRRPRVRDLQRAAGRDRDRRRSQGELAQVDRGGVGAARRRPWAITHDQRNGGERESTRTASTTPNHIAPNSDPPPVPPAGGADGDSTVACESPPSSRPGPGVRVSTRSSVLSRAHRPDRPLGAVQRRPAPRRRLRGTVPPIRHRGQGPKAHEDGT